MEKQLTTLEKLVLIQTELNVPKTLNNKFGNYKYRNAEQILKAAKPLAAKNGCFIHITDEVVMVGNRYYVKSTATLSDATGNVVSEGWAREAETKTGMDASQITGAATSYARKYALGGLFGIDDGYDADSMDNSNEGKEQPKKSNTSEDPIAKAIKDAISQVEECETVDELKSLWSRATSLHSNKQFLSAVNKRKEYIQSINN